MIFISFSNEVKKEIFSFIEKNYERKFACLYGILLYGKKMSTDIISVQSENPDIICFTEKLFGELFQNRIIPERNPEKKIRNSLLYSFNIKNKAEISEIFDFYETEKREKILVSRNLKCAFLAGAFIICGSVNSPDKEYHLEFKVSGESKAEIILDILLKIGAKAKISKRKNSFIVYLKDSESIEDVLTYIGARQCTLEIMNVKIEKNLRNRANRMCNCDTANIARTVNASISQTEDILTVDKAIGLENIPAELREVAMIRLNNSDMTLREIGESLENPISRSGVNHRLKKISEMAKQIRSGKNEQK
ncbi:MAG: DNA-binding protein WhiA [Ruminococcus sp.]|nr:DNA-binding protein WhiA [Oscillospiraceae bacterium]MDY4414578.1 DNA-binding protein WhiA [Ruminococcus sp.]